MSNPFNTGSMAAGYADSRPPVHRRILELVDAALQRRFKRVLDVGCGSGLSTVALARLAERRVGIDPAETMVHLAGTTDPGAEFLVGSAEALPFGDRAFDLISAAGSLNYVELDPFFLEAARVLESDGMLVVYDFAPGRTFADSGLLEAWFNGFVRRYPWPQGEARPVSPESLREMHTPFREHSREHFTVPVQLDFDRYLRYMLTESNVAFAVRSGTQESEIRDWCAETLRPVFDGQSRPVLFRGYYSCLSLLA